LKQKLLPQGVKALRCKHIIAAILTVHVRTRPDQGGLLSGPGELDARKLPRGTPFSGLYEEAPPKRGAFFQRAVYSRVGKIVFIGYERGTNYAAK